MAVRRQQAAQDATWLTSLATTIDKESPPTSVISNLGSDPWWLDVKTANTFQSDMTGQVMDVVDLEGMIGALETAKATFVGAYSTSSPWDSITD